MPETLEPAVERTERKEERSCGTSTANARPAIYRRVNLVSKLEDGIGPKDKVRLIGESDFGERCMK